MTERDTFIRLLPMVGAEPEILNDERIAHVVGHGHRIVSRRSVPGLDLNLDETPDAIVGRMTVRAGVQLARPVHLCFGLAHPTGRQNIHLDLVVEERAAVSVLSHCLFPVAQAAQHRMRATVHIGPGASLTYREGHYHGPHGGMQVVPQASVMVGKGARYQSDFSLLSGSVGELTIDYAVEVEEDGVAELTAKLFGHGTDRITLKEAVVLKGARSRGLIKTRVVLADEACAEITGVTEAHERGARGHVDCLEIVQGRAQASAIPIVRVCHPEAKVTHEAAIGSVDKKGLETLMARGLAPEQAIELIVSGILR
ncbi:MAG: SufD family Fe-S cluster assembly protein [Nitrospira sp.]|nr:SufD family Fe-S cluster assembly protein [Nitrospira sp.]